MATEQGYNPSVAVNEIYDTIQEKPQEMIHTRAYINLDAKTGWIPSTVGAYKYQLDITLPAREFPVTLEYQPQVIIQPNTDPTCGPLNFPYAETVGLDKVRLYAMSIPKAERMLPIMLIMQQTGAPYGSTNASSSVRTDLEVEPQGIQLSQNIVYVKTREGKDTSGNYVTLVDGDQTFRLTVTGYKGDTVAKVIVQPSSPNAYTGEDFKYKTGRYFLIYNLDGTPLVTPTHISNSDDTWTEYSSATPLSQRYNIGYQNLGQIGNQVDAAVFLKDGTVVSKGSFYLQFNVQLENGPVFTARASIFTNKVIQEEVDPMTYEMLVPSVHRNASNYYTVDNKPVAVNPFTAVCRIIDQSGETVNAIAELRLKTLNNEIISWNDGGEQTSFFTSSPLTDLGFLNDYREFILEWVIDNRVKASRLVNIASSGNSYFLTTSSEYIDTTNLIHDSSVAFQAFLFTKNENDKVSTFNGQIKVFGKDINNQETLLSTADSVHLITQIYKKDILEYRIEATIGSYVTQAFVSTVVPVKDTENIFFSFKPAVLIVETNSAFALVNTPGSNSNEISFDIRRNTGVINDQFDFDVKANGSIMHDQPNLTNVLETTVSYFDSANRTIKVLRMGDPGIARIEYTITATNKVHKSQKIIAQVSAVRQVNTTIGMVVNLYYLYSDYPRGKNGGTNSFDTSIKKTDGTEYKYTGFLNSIQTTQPDNPDLYTWVLTNPGYVDLLSEATSIRVGTAVATSQIEYALSSSPTNFVLISGKNWSLTAPTPVEGQYLWSRTKNTLINGSESYYPSSTGTNVSGIQGTGGLSVLLLNEHQSIAVNSDRKASFNQIITIPFTAFKGTTRLAATATLTGFPTTTPAISPVITPGSASQPGTIVFTIPAGHAFSSLAISGDTGSFQINITAGGQTISRVFSYSKSIPGTTGTTGVSPTIYQLKCDTEIIKRQIDGTLVPNTISVSAVSITGSSNPQNYNGIFKLFYGDSISETQTDTTKLFNLNGTDQDFIRIVLAKSDDSSILYDEQTIPIINEDPYRYTLRALSPPIGDDEDEGGENIIYTTSQYQNNPPTEILPYFGELITYEKIDLENIAFNEEDGKTLVRKFNWTLIEPPTTYYRYSKNSNGEGLIDIETLNKRTDKQDYIYMGVLTTFQTPNALDPKYYTWLLIQGPQGPQGNQGNPGPPSKEVLISGDTVLKLWRNGVDYVADQQTLIYSLNTQLEFNSVTWYYNNQEITSLDNPTFTILTDPSTKTSTLTIPTADAEIKNLSSLVISAKIYDTVGDLLGSDYISTYFLHDQSTNYYAEIVANTQARNHIFERDQYGNVLKDTIKSESLASGSIGFYLELKVYQGAILLNSDQYTSKRTDMGCIISVIDNRYYFQDIIANSGSVEAEVSIHGLQVPITLHPKFSWTVKENVVDSIKRDLQISSDTSGFVNRLLTVDDLNKLESQYDNNIANYSAGFDNQNISILISSENTTPDRYFSSINGGLDLKPILFNGCLSGELFGETDNVSVIPGQYFLIHMPSEVSSAGIWLIDPKNSAKKTLDFVSVNFRGDDQQVTIIKIPPGHLFVGRDGSTIKMYRIAAPSGGDLFNRVNFSPFANYTTAITASFLNQYNIVASPFDFKILPSGEESLIISSNIATDTRYFKYYKTELTIIVKGYFGEQQRINLNRSFLPFNSTVEALKLIKDLSTSDKMSQQDILIVKRMIETLSKDSEYEIGRATSTLKYRVPEIALPINEGEASSKNLIITRQLSDSLILEAENIPVSIAGFQESLSNQNAMYAATLDREDHVLLKIVVNNDGSAGPPAQLKINMRELSVENGQQKTYLIAQPGRTIENPLSLVRGENVFYFYSEGLLPENHLMGDKTSYEESNNSYKTAAWTLAKVHRATIVEGDSFLRESSAIDTDRFNVLYFDFIDLLSQRNLTLKEFTLFRYRPEIILTEQVLSELSVGDVKVQTLVQTLITALSHLNSVSFTSGTTDLIIDTPEDLEGYYTTALTSYQDLKDALNQAELIRNNSKQLKIQTENNYFSVGYYDKNQFVSGLQIDPLTGTLIQDSRVRVLGSTSIGALYGRKFVIGKEPTQEDLLEDKQNQYTWNNGHISIWSEGRWSSTLDSFGQTFFRYNVVENQTTLTGYMVMNSKEIAAYNIKPDAPLSFTSSTTPNVHDAAMVRDRIFEITGEGDIFIQDLSLGTDGSVDFFGSLTLIGYSSSSSSYYKLDGTSDSKSSKGMVFVGGNN